MKNAIDPLQNEIRTLFLEKGGEKASIPFVTPYRFTTESIRMPQTENPYLYVVLDGTLRLHTPSGMMDYMAGQYSVSKIDTPLSGTVPAFSDHLDFLTVSVEFMPSEIIQTVLSLDNGLTERILSEGLEEREMSASDRAVMEAVSRLFGVGAVPSDFIQNNIRREIAYYVLCGSCGKQFIKASQLSSRQMKSIRQTAGSRKISGTLLP